jgi:hypothetical protein
MKDLIGDRFEAIVYELNGITYVPHYRNDCTTRTGIPT